jgi:hypothetical protein
LLSPKLIQSSMAPSSSRSAVVQPLPSDAPRTLPDPKAKSGDTENEDQPLLKGPGSDGLAPKSETPDADGPVKSADTTLLSMKRARGLGFIVFAGLNFSIASICIKYASQRVTSHETVFWRMVVALVLNYVSRCRCTGISEMVGNVVLCWYRAGFATRSES